MSNIIAEFSFFSVILVTRQKKPKSKETTAWSILFPGHRGTICYPFRVVFTGSGRNKQSSLGTMELRRETRRQNNQVKLCKYNEPIILSKTVLKFKNCRIQIFKTLDRLFLLSHVSHRLSSRQPPHNKRVWLQTLIACRSYVWVLKLWYKTYGLGLESHS